MSDERTTVFAKVIRKHVPANSKILEIGAGEGALATSLTEAGHRVVALDPNPRGGFPVIATTFEEFEADRDRFDCVVAQYVLHHASDLDGFIAKMARLTRPDGIIAIDDYGWERSDDAQFRADRADLHTSEKMLELLDRTFSRISYEDHAYAPDVSDDDRLAFFFVGKPR
jgi:2-polyprenyl-3-methyl-5-hydroxy-6-metoxy-1,4-benzoquinol methylase